MKSPHAPSSTPFSFLFFFYFYYQITESISTQLTSRLQFSANPLSLGPRYDLQALLCSQQVKDIITALVQDLGACIGVMSAGEDFNQDRLPSHITNLMKLTIQSNTVLYSNKPSIKTLPSSQQRIINKASSNKSQHTTIPKRIYPPISLHSYAFSTRFRALSEAEWFALYSSTMKHVQTDNNTVSTSTSAAISPINMSNMTDSHHFATTHQNLKPNFTPIIQKQPSSCLIYIHPFNI